MIENIKKHLEELFGTMVGLGTSLYHIFQNQQIHIIEGIMYTFFVSIFGLSISHFYKKFLLWLDNKM